MTSTMHAHIIEFVYLAMVCGGVLVLITTLLLPLPMLLGFDVVACSCDYD